jgi:hypothetical protein
MSARLPFLFVAIAFAVAGLILVLPHEKGFDVTALFVADGIMLALSMGAWVLMRQKVAERPQAFVRGVMGATLLRLFVCFAAILAYALIKRPDVHKPTIYLMFGIYAIFTVVETLVFSRQARRAA